MNMSMIFTFLGNNTVVTVKLRCFSDLILLVIRTTLKCLARNTQEDPLQSQDSWFKVYKGL